MTLDEAVTRGEGFRSIGASIVIGALMAPVVSGVCVETLAGIAACYKVSQTLYHFAMREAQQKILKDGIIRVGSNNLYDFGVYATRCPIKQTKGLQVVQSRPAIISQDYKG